MPTVEEIRRLLDMDDEAIEAALEEAVLASEGLARQAFPQTVPPQSIEEIVRSMGPRGVRRSITDFIKRDVARTQDDLYDAVCVKLKYCERKKTMDRAALLRDLAIAAAIAANPELWPLAPVVVYLEKQRYFEKLCKCK